MSKKGNKSGLSKYLPTILIVGAIVLVIGFIIYAMTRPDASKQSSGPATANDVAQLSTGNTLGNAKSKVTLVEFGDFQCPACGSWYPFLHDTLFPAYQDKILIVFKQYPLEMHKNAQAAAQAAQAASVQSKFWEMYSKLYSTQKDWENDSDPKGKFEGYAREIGLDIDKYKNDFNSDAVKNAIKDDQALGDKFGLPGTPSFLINGVLQNPKSFADLQTAIDQALAATK